MSEPEAVAVHLEDMDVMSEAGLRSASAIGAVRFGPLHFGIAAEAHSRASKHGEARLRMESAFKALAHNHDMAFAAELHRMRAGLSLQASTDERDAPEGDFRKAFQITRQHKSPSLHVRAAHDLARLLAERGERQQAADLLAPIYAGFTEGSDTLDLKEARNLLDELHA